MSPKTSTTAIVSLIALLSLTLTVTQSLAQQQCNLYRTVSELLESYEMPGGLFPGNVESFTCDPIDAFSLQTRIQLQSTCSVTNELSGVVYTADYRKQISAVVSRRQLTNLVGVNKVSLYAESKPFGPLDKQLTPDQVKFTPLIGAAFYVEFFNSHASNFSPPLPIQLIPSQPKPCLPPSLRQAALEDHQAEDKKRHANDNQQGTPNDNYGGRGLLRPAGLLLLNN